VLQFALSIVIAGVFLAYSEGTKGIVDRFAVRLAPDTGRNMRALAEQTVRGVATGVVGIAMIQCVLTAIALFTVDFPGAPLLALLCLLVAICQLPLAIPVLPMIIYVWAHEPALTATLFTAWMIPVTLLDNILNRFSWVAASTRRCSSCSSARSEGSRPRESSGCSSGRW
jgi:predicted PurR-regulated permease PerM